MLVLDGARPAVGVRAPVRERARRRMTRSGRRSRGCGRRGRRRPSAPRAPCGGDVRLASRRGRRARGGPSRRGGRRSGRPTGGRVRRSSRIFPSGAADATAVRAAPLVLEFHDRLARPEAPHQPARREPDRGAIAVARRASFERLAIVVGDHDACVQRGAGAPGARPIAAAHRVGGGGGRRTPVVAASTWTCANRSGGRSASSVSFAPAASFASRRAIWRITRSRARHRRAAAQDRDRPLPGALTDHLATTAGGPAPRNAVQRRSMRSLLPPPRRYRSTPTRPSPCWVRDPQW